MDEDVFRGKLKQYKDTVYRIAFTYLRNQADAEDVAQETFLKFYLREKPFPDVGSEKAWLIRVTLNACHKIWRLRLKRRRTMHCTRRCSPCRKNIGW